MSASSGIERLRQQIHLLEDARKRFSRTVSVADAVDAWLPYGGLSAGCIHEVKGSSLAGAIAFSAILSARLAGKDGNILYIASDRLLYPLGLLPYGVKPERILHISPRRTQDLAWAVMEALQCSQVSSVIALPGGLDQTASRRLQLAAEGSGATGFLLGHATSAPVASAITRWKVSSVTGRSGQRFDEPVWEVDLLYCRGGRPGNWILEWRGEKLHGFARQQPLQSLPHALAL
jgi:protein ImuA